MKTKYYLNNDFMSASLRSHRSYTWRSIWGAWRFLEQGIGWRVGNDRMINIWNDAWLPGPEQGKIVIRNIDINYIVVADLINTESGTWKSKALRDLFDEEQVSRIMIIPIIRVELGDERVWRGDNTRV